MGIRMLRVHGFRSLRDVSWTPARLNLVIGPNGSGKSNLLRALALLQSSAKGHLSQDIIDVGGMGALSWDGQTREVGWGVKTDPLDPERDPDRESLTYELALAQLGATSSYRISRELLCNSYLKDIGQKPEPKKFLDRRPGHATTFDFEERRLIAHGDDVPDEQTFLSLVQKPFGNQIVLRYREQLSAWSIHQGLRVDSASPIRRANVSRIERRVDPDGQNLVPVLHTLYTGNREFEQTVDNAMRAAFGDDYEKLVFPPAEDQRVQLRIRWRSLRTEQSAADLSDGTLRFLLLVAILASPNRAPLIAIDEPEVGLHPSMLPIVAELAAEAAEHVQVILTTHSPQLLDAFGEHQPTTTVARWLDGQTRIGVVDPDALRTWLSEYSLGSLFRSGELEAMS